MLTSFTPSLPSTSQRTSTDLRLSSSPRSVTVIGRSPRTTVAVMISALTRALFHQFQAAPVPTTARTSRVPRPARVRGLRQEERGLAALGGAGRGEGFGGGSGVADGGWGSSVLIGGETSRI